MSNRRNFRSSGAAPTQANRSGQILFGTGVEAPEPPKVSEEVYLTQQQEEEIAMAEYMNMGQPEQPTAEPPTEQPAEPITEPTTEPAKPTVTPTDKFEGKTREEILDMYRNLEELNGKQRNEVGEYRRMFDEFVLNQSRQTQQPAQQTISTEPSEDEKRVNEELLNVMLTNPRKFLELSEQRAIERITAQERVQKVRVVQEQNKETLLDPSFRTWVAQYIPPQLAVAADNDPAQLQSILNLYKSTNTAVPQPIQPEAPRLDPSVSVRPAGPSAGTQAVHKVPTSKIWSREEIRTVYRTDPDKYKALEPEIVKAYQEGRVRGG